MTKIVAFRPQKSLDASREMAERYGFDFFGFPLFELVEREEALTEIKNVFETGVGVAVAGGVDLDLVVFTSANGVRKSFDICEGEFDLKKKLLEVKICAIGPLTEKELAKHGLKVALMPDDYSSEGLKKLLKERVKNRKILFLRSSEANKNLLDYLTLKGAFIKDISVYRVAIKDSEEEKELFLDLIGFKPDYIAFTSSLTFKTFLDLANKFALAEKIFGVLSVAKIAAIGELTARTIKKEGIEVDIIPEKSTFEDILKEIRDKK